MANNDETAPANFFSEWREELFKNSALKAKVALLQSDIAELNERLAGMVPREKAKQVAYIMHEKGQLQGKKELESSLIFPWPPEKTKLFSELGKAYMESLSYRATRGRKKPPGAKAQEKYQKDIDLFIAVMGDVRIGIIDREVAGGYFATLKRLPANMNKIAKFRGKTIPEILAMKPTPQSEVTISGKLGTLSTMFKWALEEKRKWGIDANPFAGFAIDGDSVNVRRPFTHVEMLALLNHPNFQERKFTKAYGYWIITLGIFTGARLGELCQLELSDFVEIDGIPCIDINDIDDEAGEGQDHDEEWKRGKSVKTKNGKRLIPIHPTLIDIGILRYVDELKKKGEVYLFPELSRERRDGPAHAASNWFQRFRAKVGVTKKQATVFHSFRHYFITTLADSGISPHMIAPIVGHERDLITGKVYWNVKDATKRKPTVDAFTLPADLLALIPPVEGVSLPQQKTNRKARIGPLQASKA